MAVSAEVAAAWAQVAQFIILPVISQSRTAPLRTTVRLAATAATVTQITEVEQEEEDFLEMAVTDAGGGGGAAGGLVGVGGIGGPAPIPNSGLWGGGGGGVGNHF